MKKKAHVHEYHVEEFYTGTQHVLSVAILTCEGCDSRVWEEMYHEDGS